MTSLRLALPLALRRARLARLPGRLFFRLLAAQALVQSRRRLTRLDDHILRDIGLTRAEAEDEASRPAWDAPLHWRG